MARDSWAPVAHHAVRHIQQEILNGRFKPGSRLPSQRELALALKVSRASLREALSALESLGLVRIEPGRGSFVNDPAGGGPGGGGPGGVGPWRFAERYPLGEVYQLRYALEGFIAGQAATAIDESGLAELEASWRAMRDAVGRSDLAGAADADSNFHRILLEVCGNSMIRETWNGIRSVLFASQTLPFGRHDKGMEPVAEHRDIVDAVARRDRDGARRAMEDHIRRAAARVGVKL